MKKYMTTLATYITTIIASVLAATWLTAHTPWWALIPMTIITLCGATYINYRRFFNDNQ